MVGVDITTLDGVAVDKLLLCRLIVPTEDLVISMFNQVVVALDIIKATFKVLVVQL